MKPIITIMMLLLTLTACNTTAVYSKKVGQDELNKLNSEKVVAAATRVDGIDIWEKGIPARQYKTLGMIHYSRRNKLVDHQRYLNDIASMTKKVGGDAAIVILQDSVVVDKKDQPYESGVNEPNPSDVKIMYTLERESKSVPLEYKLSNILVIKYLDSK